MEMQRLDVGSWRTIVSGMSRCGSTLLVAAVLACRVWANSEITVELPNNATMDVVWVEPGTFAMGMTAAQQGQIQDLGLWLEGFGNMLPDHEVTISEGFYLGKYEVTQGQWEAVMAASLLAAMEDDPALPVTLVSWNDIDEFLRRLNEADGDTLYRLPTEAEWEYAARAGTTTLWSFADADIRDHAWFYLNACLDCGTACSQCYAEPVGRKRPNPWGLHDMHGNVWELTSDAYARAYSAESQLDPVGPDLDPAVDGRVMRGGDITVKSRPGDPHTELNTSSPFRGQATEASPRIGFRVVMEKRRRGLRADAGRHRWAAAGEIRLDGTGSVAGRTGSLTYAWSEHPGNPATGLLDDSSSATPTVAATELGTYRFSLQVADGDEVSPPDEVVVEVVGVAADGTVALRLLDEVTMDFVWVETDTFTMGISAAQERFMRERELWHRGRYESSLVIDSGRSQPAHPVDLTRGFYMAKYELTQGQWTAIMGTKPWTEKLTWAYAQDYEYLDDPQRPAVIITWGGLTGMVERLNEAAGYTRFGIPTEAQWEYAALAGSSGLWSFGYDVQDVVDHAWHFQNVKGVGLGSPQPVGGKAPNRWGLHDMDGNVKEWCQHFFYVYPESGQVDPSGPRLGGGRAMRGGDFRTRATSSRERFSMPADSERDHVGARLIAHGPKMAPPVGEPLYPLPDIRIPAMPPTAEVPPPGAPVVLVLDEDFGDGADGWVPHGGKESHWTAQGGTYRLTDADWQSVSHYPAPLATNYTLEVRLRVERGEGFVLFSRADGEALWRIGVNVHRQRLQSLSSQEIRVLEQPPPPPGMPTSWLVSRQIDPLTWYDVRVDVRTTAFDAYFNGELIYEDVPLGKATPTGVIGVGGGESSREPARVEFEHVRLWHGLGSSRPSAPRLELQLRNAPNPFNVETTVSYATDPADGLGLLTIYNVAGQTVWQRALPATSGLVVWDGRDRQGIEVASGVYIARLRAGGRQRTHRVLLLR